MIWTILGVAVGVAGAFCIVAAELLRAFPVLDGWRGVIAAVLAALGATVGLTGMLRRRALPETDEETSPGLTGKFGLPFWGAMLLVGAGIVLFIQPMRRAEPVARPAPVRPAPSPVVKAAPPPITNAPVVFPPLKIQGCIIVGDQPVVLIDGEAFGVGDQVHGLTVKSLTREAVVMELGGETKKYKVP
jgi:hypothetical protein